MLPPPSILPYLATAAGFYHTVALRADGSVTCWGKNTDAQCTVPVNLAPARAVVAGSGYSGAIQLDGQLRLWGLLAASPAYVPANLGAITRIADGADHLGALRSDGTTIWWGNNGNGECNAPPNLGAVSALAAGGGFSCVVRASGSIQCWGANAFGQCNPPAGLQGVVAIEAGDAHCVALKSNGTVVAWGSNLFQQTSVPTNLSGVVEISSCYNQNYARRADGSLAMWGQSSLLPAGLPALASISAGVEHATALTRDGKVVAFGVSPLAGNLFGQRNLPRQLPDAVAVAAGGFHNLVLHADGSVSGWGRNDYGQAEPPLEGSPLSRIESRGSTNAGLRANGTLLCWGYNGSGQCNVPPTLGSVVDFSVGTLHVVALKTTGTIACWGSNASQQCAVPANIGAPADVEAGPYHTGAIRTDGSVVCWGDNFYGQCNIPQSLGVLQKLRLGDGNSMALRANGTLARWGYFIEIPAGLSNVVDFALSGLFAVALRADGTIVCFGSNVYGVSTPPGVLQGVVSVKAGAYHELALLNAERSSCTNAAGIGTATLSTSGSAWQNTGIWSWSNGGGAQVPGAQTNVDLGTFGSVGSLCDARAGTLTARSGSTLIVPADLTQPSQPDHSIDVTGQATMAGRVWLVGSGASALPANLDVPVLSTPNPQGTFDILQSTVPAPPGKFLALVPVSGLAGNVSYRLRLLDLPSGATLSGNASAAFSGTAVAAETMDLNGDGFDDLAIAIDFGPSSNGAVEVLINDGLGNLDSTSIVLASVPPQPNSIATGDINGDGRDDLVVGIASNNTAPSFNGGGGGLGTLTPSTTYLGVGNVLSVAIIPSDASGPAQVIIGTAGVTNRVSTYSPGGPAPAQQVVVQPQPAALARRGRIVGAGGTTASNVDQFMGANLLNENGALVVLTPDSGGTYSVSQTIAVPGKPVLMDFLDIDGDGFGDIVTANQSPVPQGPGVPLPVLTLFRGGASGLGNPVPIAPDGTTSGLDVTLLDADGDDDLDIVAVGRTLVNESKAVLIRIDTTGPGSPLAIGAETTITATRPILSARGDLDGVGGVDLYLVDAGAPSSFKRSAPSVARPFHGNLTATSCPADINRNHAVNGDDLAILLSNWGGTGAADIDRDGLVNGNDLAILLAAWGACQD